MIKILTAIIAAAAICAAFSVTAFAAPESSNKPQESSLVSRQESSAAPKAESSVTPKQESSAAPKTESFAVPKAESSISIEESKPVSEPSEEETAEESEASEPSEPEVIESSKQETKKNNYSFSDQTQGNAVLTAIEEVVAENENYQFIAATTRDGNVFYIIIDKLKATDNVYFLNQVDTYDLQALLTSNEKNTESSGIIKIGSDKDKENSSDEKEETTNKKSGGLNSSLIIVAGIAVLGTIGFVVFKVKKGGGKKKAQQTPMLDDDFDDEDEINEDKE